MKNQLQFRGLGIFLLSLLFALPLHAQDWHVEDFENSSLTGSYATGSFVGNYGITWEYADARNEAGDSNKAGISGKALLFRTKESKYETSLTARGIEGGIKDFSIKLYKAFTGGGDRQIEVFVNGEKIGVSPAFDEPRNEVNIYEIFDVNVAGSFDLEIRNVGRQIILDDISWTSFDPENAPTIEISLEADVTEAYEAEETVVTLTASASEVLEEDATFKLLVNGSVSTEDYVLSSTEITILAGEQEGTATFTVVNDNIAEPVEQAMITFERNPAYLTSAASVSVTIFDNDAIFYQDFETSGPDYNDDYADGWYNIYQRGGRSWQSRNFGGNRYAQYTAYGSKRNPEIGWLISPTFGLVATDNDGKLFFKVNNGYANGATLKVLLLENFDGDIENALATAIELPFGFVDTENNYGGFIANEVDLSAYSGQLNIAFQYTGGGSLTTTWQIDDIYVTGKLDDHFGVDLSDKTNVEIEGEPVAPEVGDGEMAEEHIVVCEDTENPIAGINAIKELTTTQTLDVVTFNIEWLGYPEKSGNWSDSREAQIEAAALEILELNADILALQEIVIDDVNGDALADLLAVLNEKSGAEVWAGDYNEYFSYWWNPDFKSFPAQRQCFIYDTRVVEKVEAFTLLTDQIGEGSNLFGSGRLPFVLKANVNVNGVSKLMHFVNLHMKCCTDSEARRLASAEKLVAELQKNYADENVVILGDFNVATEGGAFGEIERWGIYADSEGDCLADYLHAAGSKVNLDWGGIDHILISNELYDELAYVAADQRNHKLPSFVSDHDPYRTRLYIYDESAEEDTEAEEDQDEDEEVETEEEDQDVDAEDETEEDSEVEEDQDEEVLSNGLEQKYSVYPTMVTDYLYININEAADLIVLSQIGSVVKQERLKDGRLYCGSLPSGVYLLKIEGHAKAYRFVKL